MIIPVVCRASDMYNMGIIIPGSRIRLCSSPGGFMIIPVTETVICGHNESEFVFHLILYCFITFSLVNCVPYLTQIFFADFHILISSVVIVDFVGGQEGKLVALLIILIFS